MEGALASIADTFIISPLVRDCSSSEASTYEYTLNDFLPNFNALFFYSYTISLVAEVFSLHFINSP